MAKLAISNIAWSDNNDAQVYELMKKFGVCGLEIAPTRVFPEAPYDKLIDAGNWAKQIHSQYGFVIPSMQSIWFGKTEMIFGCESDRMELISYTKKAIDFAEAIGCKNLVFGCPKNRNLPNNADDSCAVSFFKELAEYALEHHTVIGMEANPPIYNTNYINTTASAFELIDKVNSKGFLLNLDVGTIICNEEDINDLSGKVGLINHVHISEPNLKPIKERQLHIELAKLLKKENYSGFISIEMSKRDTILEIEQALYYVNKVFS